MNPRIPTPSSTDHWLSLAARHPYEFSIQYPQDPGYVQKRYAVPPLPRLHDGDGALSLYLHIPFCQSRCDFCNYHTLTGADRGLMARYAAHLLKEFEALAPLLAGKSIAGMDIGGGTPTLLPPDLLEQILSLLTPLRPAERPPHFFSTESTPSRVLAAPETLLLLAENVDRLSLGLQAFSGSRSDVGRRINAAENERAFGMARDAGFTLINTDIIFGLPGQTMGQWETTLRENAALRPDSITAYDCLYARGGRVFTPRHAPAQEFIGRCYDRAYEILTGAGYHAPYGSLVFTATTDTPGMSLYFTERFMKGTPYAGLGLGASGMSGDYWYFREGNMDAYDRGVQSSGSDHYAFFYALPSAERFTKLLFYHLHCGVIDPVLLEDATGLSLERDYREALDEALTRQWIEKREMVYGLRPGSFGHLPQLRALFYPAAAQSHFMEQLLPALT